MDSIEAEKLFKHALVTLVISFVVFVIVLTLYYVTK